MNTGEFKRLVPMYVWVTSFLVVFGLLLSSREIVVRKTPDFQHIFWLATGVVIGALVVLILAHYRANFWGYRIIDPLPLKDWRTAMWIGVGVLVAVVITVLSAIVDRDRMDHILDKHGNLFDWFMGSLTIVGIWLTYNTIVETQRIIRSFGQLYDRVIKLVADTEDNDQLHFLAYTASIGYLALPEAKWNKLVGALTTLGKDQLKMICLDNEDLSVWHNHYIGRNTRRRPADAARALTLEDTREATRQAARAAEGANCRRLRSELMPGFYLIFNSRRAIIVAPFFIPPHPLTLLSMENPNTQGVQMFGFETTDPHIVDDVRRLFEYYWDSPSNEPYYFDSESGSADGLPAKLTEKLKKWASDPAQQNKCMRYRLFVAEEDPWDKILSYLSTKLSAADYSKYLNKKTLWTASQDKLLISVETAEQKDWIEKHCRKHIDEAVHALLLDMKVEILVK